MTPFYWLLGISLVCMGAGLLVLCAGFALWIWKVNR